LALLIAVTRFVQLAIAELKSFRLKIEHSPQFYFNFKHSISFLWRIICLFFTYNFASVIQILLTSPDYRRLLPNK
jgi:type IV secretory pathway component VirB8